MKQLFIILFLFLSTTCFSATRQEIQAALDLIRFVNITNDMVDSAIPSIRGQRKSNDGSDMTVEDIKDGIVRLGLNIKNYRNLIDTFLAEPENVTLAINGLNALGLDHQSLKNDIKNIDDTINSVKVNLANVNTFEDLNLIADEIEVNIDKLPLVRKSK